MAEHNFSLLDDATRECPYQYFQHLRHSAPISFLPELNAWYVSRYDDLRYVKKHPELFSSDIRTHGGIRPGARSVAEAYRSEHGWARVSTLQRTDPPVHSKYRKLINHAFTVKRVRSMTPYIETVVNDLIDAFINHGKAEFVSEYSIPLPCIVIADQLGVPRDMIWQLKSWSDAMLAPGSGFIDETQALEAAKQVVEAQQFFATVIEARRAQPTDDIISVLANAQIEDEPGQAPRPLDMFELMDLLDQLLTGGNETTTNAIGSCMMLLLQRPDMMIQLRDDPQLLRNMVEETLRYETPVLHLWRVATQDTEIDGVEIKKGDTVALGYASANRDEAVFPDPETFNPSREKAGAHLAFGSGPHHCPGAALSRQEIYSTFTVLLNRLENIRTTNPDEGFLHTPNIFLRGLADLNITFDVRNPQRYLPNASAY
ncbi:MAG: cytochrome P450 [Pseudomonadota bacterium]